MRSHDALSLSHPRAASSSSTDNMEPRQHRLKRDQEESAASRSESDRSGLIGEISTWDAGAPQPSLDTALPSYTSGTAGSLITVARK
jgi:hypothetical protein